MNRTNTTTGEDVTQTAEIDFTNERYTTWIESLSTRYRESQIKAAVAVNTEMLKFYFGLGRDITLMEKGQPWGSGFLKRVSLDLKRKMPEADCFSPTNLAYMRRFFELYANIIYPQLGGKMGTTESLLQIGAKTDSANCPQVGDELDSPIYFMFRGGITSILSTSSSENQIRPCSMSARR